MMIEFNSKNKLLVDKNVVDILRKANISETPEKINIFQQAFVHKSYVLTDKNSKLKVPYGIVPFQKNNYERLEFYGDSIIGASCVQYLYNRYPEFDEGILTKLKNRIVSSEILSQFARYYNFQDYVLISNSTENNYNSYGRESQKILVDCFESFVAAISIEIGYIVAHRFVLNTIDKLINFGELLAINRNYKDRILKFFQKNSWKYPIYEIDSQIGLQNKKTFVINLYKGKKEDKILICNGVGRTKKEAEMHASYNALFIFHLLSYDEI